MEKFFKLRENNTDVKTEVFAGITTFLTMAYILFVNPDILSLAGMDKSAVFIATILAAVVGTLVMGLFANVPFAQAPGMGLNAFFTFTICKGMGFKWQEALAMVFICGLINILITVTKVRKAIIHAIPLSLQYAISGGIGLFIAYIGLINSGFLKFLVETPFALFQDKFSGEYTKVVPSLTGFTTLGSLVALAGLIITVVLLVKNVKGSILIGIVATTILAIVTGLTKVSGLTLGTGAGLSSISNTFLQLDLKGLFVNHPGKVLLILSTIFAFSLTDTFDTIGTFLGTGRKSGIFDAADEKNFEENNGYNSKLEKALIADATATSIGALFGTSNTTTYVESAAGIAAGGRTGLTSVVTAALFLLSLILLPVIGIIPAQATSPALIIVGILMVESIGKIKWEDLEEAIPAFFTLAMMPLAYSITSGITAGFIFYCLVKLAKGKGKEVHAIMYIVTALFIVSMILNAVVK